MPVAVASCALAAFAFAACVAVAPTGIHLQTQGGGGAGGAGGGLAGLGGGPPANPPPDAAGSDPHAVIGANPSHGAFNGGDVVLVSGRGFTSKARVWFGPNEVDETTTVPVSPDSVQVITPPGTAGPVDLIVQDGDDTSTQRTLAGGYSYDALYAVPDVGPVPGGTVIQIAGQGTSWDATTVAAIDQNPCTTLTVNSPTLLTCTVPAGTPGGKTITVTTSSDGGSETILVLDGYTYQDSSDGFKGGLSGAPLAGQLTVLVYDNFTGDPIPGALVVVGSDIATAIQAMSDASGVTVIDDSSLTTPQTVTVAAECHGPISFVTEPVNTVTAYLDPVLSPACGGSGDPPPVGGKVGQLGEVTGQLVWPLVGEFMEGGWSNVPSPIGKTQQQVAYVFAAASDPTQPFQLPDISTAVTPAMASGAGYPFSIELWPGNASLYAIAGIEDTGKSPPEFTGYAMGAVNGVPVLPGQITGGVYIAMSQALNQALTLDVSPPAPGPQGPDRLDAEVAVNLGHGGYALLPIGQKSPFLPLQGNLDFVGLPGLDGPLAGALYVATASAVTGPTATAPMSVVTSVQTNNTAQVLAIGGFVSVPQLTTPATGTVWDGVHLATTFPPGGAVPDLTVYDISAGNGLMHWTVAAPGGSQAISLPSLAGFPQLALPPGPLVIGVYGAKIANFDYGSLRYVQMTTRGMSAYSLSYFNANL